MKKILSYIIIFIVLFATNLTVYAIPPENPSTQSSIDRSRPCEYDKNDTTHSNPTNLPCGEYKLLVPLPGTNNQNVETIPVKEDSALGIYLNIMLRIFIGVCAVLAMAMIVLGGLEYMTSELISSKESGKKKITGALFGLILALGSYALLNTINPDLLNIDTKNLKPITVEVLLEPEVGIAAKTITLSNNGQPVQLNVCDKSQMVVVPVFGKSVEVYRGVVKSLKDINDKWLATPEAQRYKVSSIAGYKCREVAGKPNFWSSHAFGLAIDINPETNPFGRPPLKTDMPASFYNLFRAKGWGWGGDWQNIKDPMHFSKYPLSEYGNTVIEL